MFDLRQPSGVVELWAQTGGCAAEEEEEGEEGGGWEWRGDAGECGWDAAADVILLVGRSMVGFGEGVW